MSPTQKSVRVTVQYYEEDFNSMEMAVTLSRQWLEKTAQHFVDRFFVEYAARHPGMAAVDPTQYHVIDVARKSVLDREKRLIECNLVDGGVLFVTRLGSLLTTAEMSQKSASHSQGDNDDDFELFCDANCLYMYGQRSRESPLLSYARCKARLGRLVRDGRRPSVRADTQKKTSRRRIEKDCSSPESSDQVKGTNEFGSLSEKKGVKCEPKDWARINYRKSLCRHVVAGRRCPEAERCTYAHTYEELRVIQRQTRPGVCSERATADHTLPPPELWQLGVFADPARRQPQLWPRMSRRSKLLGSVA